ncbi:alpha/beta hydrolase family protein [Novipirellula sp. SH528]|uniref:alpha/beta hydrolase family protein n=1 Tax=Novipirellula sp. SH528 TaxID=3454466 RepID=UPI003F9FD7AD
MKVFQWALLMLLLGVGCGREANQGKPANASRNADGQAEQDTSFADARRAFKTHLVRQEKTNEAVPTPPSQLFEVVQFDSPVGKLAAYLSRPQDAGGKQPAIIWVFGGFDNSIGETAWEDAAPDNDQSASAFRESGIVMMYPSFRGGNENPGFRECCYGEVEDVIAAAEYLAKQDFVDPNRIYLGGHSTGGTLVIVAAAASDRFRAVFSFGAIDEIISYSSEPIPFDYKDKQELRMRSPVHWLSSIKVPTFVFEGSSPGGNLYSLYELKRASKNPLVQFHPVKGKDHFSVLAPMTKLIAEKIVLDTGPQNSIEFSSGEIARHAKK